MYIGLISDTHGVFSDGFRKFLEPVDVIWHAGDFGGGLSFVVIVFYIIGVFSAFRIDRADVDRFLTRSLF